MIRRLVSSAVVALVLAVPAIRAQQTDPVPPAPKPIIPAKPWPEDDVMLARRTDAENRKLFQDGRPLEFTLTSEFGSMNKERTPNNGKLFPGVLTVDGANIPVKLSSRGHLRLTARICDFVPIKVEFMRDQTAGTLFEGQTTLKLGTHCQTGPDADQYVIREYLAYKLANLVTPLSFRARLARATYVEARSEKKGTSHRALFLEHENDVARRLNGREVRQSHMVFNEFDKDGLTTMMLLEYMLGNTDYSIWGLHNVVVVQDKKRKFFPVPYDFDLSGMVHPPYATPEVRLQLRSVTDRLYRGPCRTVEEFDAVAAPFRARKAEMLAAIDSVGELTGLNGLHRGEMKDYLESFFQRIATPEAIKKTFVNGCPASRSRV